MWWNINKIFSFWIIWFLRSTQLIMWSEYSYLELFVVLYCIFRLKIFLAKVPRWFFSDSKTLFYSFSFLSHLIIVIPIINIVTFITTSSDNRFKTRFSSLAWRRRLVIIRILIGGWMFGVALSWPVVFCLIWFNIIFNGMMH